MTGNNESWYELIEDESLLQGDFLDKVPIPIPPDDIVQIPDSDEVFRFEGEYRIQTFNVVVMSQSCDLFNLDNDDEVLLCHRFSYQKGFEDNPGDGRSKWAMYAKRKITSPYLLNRCDIDDHTIDFQLVDFHRLFTAPFRIIQLLPSFNERRLRLKSPYREHLSQAFAKVFMRVGLPNNLPRDYPY